MRVFSDSLLICRSTSDLGRVSGSRQGTRSASATAALLGGLLLLGACGSGLELASAEEQSAIAAGSAEEAAVLALVNDSATDFPLLDDDVGLDRRAAANLVARRDGADAVRGTADDALFTTIAEVDAVAYVGTRALEDLLRYALAHGFGGEAPEQDAVEAGVLLFVNDPSTSLELLDDDVGLDARAARNIWSHKTGLDEVLGTDDDGRFESMEALDDVAYVGRAALDALTAWAIDHGWVARAEGASIDVIFSPQLYPMGHTARAKALIDDAQTSLDIAMYSFSDYGLYDALESAAARGVEIRIVFETANADRKEEGEALEGTRSARLENLGADVRWVNKIMHHKFVIADGPRDDVDAARSASVATGSGNWSYGAATRYDENTLFFTGEPLLTLQLQAEFNLMWEHSKDFALEEQLPAVPSALTITDAMLDDAGDPSDGEVFFTSDNFDVNPGSTTFRINGGDTVANALVDAIDGATESIWVASGHLRSRKVSEALMAKAESAPDVDIRVYLDGQEWVSTWSHDDQVQNRADCLADASTASQERRCYDRGFRYGYALDQLAGIPVRYKHYSYRWHYSYAVQMHHKLLIIDSDELWTGSYNLSDNAEHNTFENMFVLRGERFQAVVDAYEANFAEIWETNTSGTYEALWDEVATSDLIPLVYDPMALTWTQVDELKSHLRDNCSVINSAAYRTEPEKHKACPR